MPEDSAAATRACRGEGETLKRWKKITLALLFLLLVAQVPFVYRRYRLGRLSAAVAALNAERRAAEPGDSHDDYAGVFHVHSSLGGHSTGTLEDIVRGAKANRLAFVVMTEHPSAFVNTAEATLKGLQEGVLFVNGSELSLDGGERLFVVPGFDGPAPTPNAPDLQALVNRAKEEGRLAFIAYPEQVRDWRLVGFDGVEVYNLYTNTKEINYALLAGDAIWSYWSYPDLLFSTFYRRPDADLKKWDEINAAGVGRRASAVAGNDAHANVGLSLRDQTGEEFLGIKLDPYERSFRVVRNHVLVEKGQALSAETLLAALRDGHSYIAFDLFCDAGGFRFTAHDGVEERIMGDEIALAGRGLKLSARVPVRSRIVFFRDGQVVHEEKEALGKELTVERPGVYRVEVYLERLGSPSGDKPWIISNPIYVR